MEYDANAQQRFEFEVTEGGVKYDTAHLYQPLSESRYIEFLHSIKAKGNEREAEENEIEVKTALWNDLVSDVENLDKGGLDNWKDLIDYGEKRESLEKYLSVAVVEPETKSTGMRQLINNDVDVVTTEAFFNFPNVVTQTHKLKKKNDDWRRKYSRIKQRVWKVEQTKGLRRDPKVEFVPQDEAFGGLYDEMKIEATGFKDNIIPLRFKVRVIHYIFDDSKLDEKK